MSADEPNPRASEGEPLDRAEVLDLLATGMRECHRKVESGRMTDTDRERARQGWHQSLAKLANAYRLLSRDRDIDEMHERLDRIEEETSGSGSGSDYRLK